MKMIFNEYNYDANYDATDEFGKYVIESVRDRVVKEILDSLDGKGMSYVSNPPFDNQAQKNYAFKLAVWAVASTLGEFFLCLMTIAINFNC